MSGFAFALLLALQDPRAELRAAISQADAAKAKTAVEALVALDTPQAVEALLFGLGAVKKEQVEARLAKEAEAANNRRPARGRTAHDAKLDALAAIRSAILDALPKFATDAAVQALVDRFRSSPDWYIRAGIASVFEHIDKDNVLAALIEQLTKEKEPTVRVAILEALSNKKGPGVESALLEALKSDVWQLQLVALQAVEKQKLISAVEGVIEGMAKADGRVLHEFQRVLTALTGVDKGIMPDAWKAWWDQNKEAVRGGTYEPRPEEKAGKAGALTTFFGVPITSKRVIFVLDRSGSMSATADFDLPADKGEADLPDDLKKPAGSRQIDIARWQLKKALFRMPDGAFFNLIFYGSGFEVYRDRMIKLDKTSRRDAFAYIDQTEPKGGTNIFDSLEKALSYSIGEDGRLKKDGADTVYLMSDGMPGQGKYIAAGDICREIKAMNEKTKIAIHTILIDAGAGGNVVVRRVNGKEVPQPKPEGPTEAEQLMKRLAEENGGTFSAIRKKENRQ